ncbi:MAG: RdgB/HAM1 family non-canonical purine NTP pyrophosphatase [Clostridia bacterium]|nr:RdgB/HAM1 family non-canonical purine NTP pyrophosphatase [Oscillospiraceae bacterium]MBO5358578.1 RdgB/HAM1 family non-canonical purine NTP pyrophosphatase [Clostridia bacterium]
MKIFIATKNQKKLRELKRILIPMGFDVLCEADLDFPFKDAVEDGQTFEENAIIKAKSGLSQTGYITVADDSGICVDYLGGAPGVFSARYSGEHGNDEQNNDKLLSELSGVPMEKRTAYYVAAIACVFPDGRQFTVRGECHGHIAFERQTGSGGFGYDPLFISEKGPFSQLTAEQKDAISHRGRALVLFKEELKKYIEV